MKSHLYAITAITLAMTAMTTLWAAGATGAAVLGLLVAPLYPADWLAPLFLVTHRLGRMRGFGQLMHWVRRYLPAELIGTTATLLAAWLASLYTSNPLVIGVAGAWGEFFGFYGPMFVQELRAERKTGASLTPGRFLLVLRNLVTEFGFAEVVDSLLIRPAFIALAVSWAPVMAAGVIAGKLAADISFYAFAVAGYQVRVKLWGK
jgi:hypothetical protein